MKINTFNLAQFVVFLTSSQLSHAAASEGSSSKKINPPAPDTTLKTFITTRGYNDTAMTDIATPTGGNAPREFIVEVISQLEDSTTERKCGEPIVTQEGRDRKITVGITEFTKYTLKTLETRQDST